MPSHITFYSLRRIALASLEYWCAPWMVFLCAVHLHLIPQHSFTWLPLLCLFIWLSSLCQSVPFLSSRLSLLLISFRWLGFVPPPSITSAHCGLLPGSPALHLFPLWTWLSLSEIGVSYFDSSPLPLLFAFPLLFLTFVRLFVYLYTKGMSGGRAVRMDWWMTRGHGWGDLGIRWMLLSVSVLLKGLACSLF